MSELILDAQGGVDGNYKVFFSTDNSKVFVTNQYIGRIIDVESGNSIKTFDYANMESKDIIDVYDYGTITNSDSVSNHLSTYGSEDPNYFTEGFLLSGNYQDNNIIYLFANTNYYKIDFTNNTFSHVENFRQYCSTLTAEYNLEVYNVKPDSTMTNILLVGFFYTDNYQSPAAEVINLDTGTSEMGLNTTNYENLYRPPVPADITPDGNTIAIVEKINNETEVRVYDVATGKSSLQLFQKHNNEITHVGFIDNSTAISGDITGKLIKWDISTFEVLDEFTMHGNSGVWDFEYFDYVNIEHTATGETLTDSGDGLTFNFTNSPLKEGTVTIYDNGTEATSGFTIDYENGSVTFDSSPTTPVTADYTWLEQGEPRKAVSGGYSLRVYNIANKSLFVDEKLTDTGAIYHVSVSPDETMVTGVTNKGDVNIYDLDLTVVTNSATDIKYNSTTLNGQLYNMRGFSSLDCYFEISPDPNFEVKVKSSTVTTMTEVGEFSASVSGLDVDTKYYYRALATPTP